MSSTTGYPDLLAGGITQEDSYAPFHLFAGEKQTVSDQLETGATGLRQFEVYMLDANDKATPWDGTAGKAIGCAAQPIPANSTGPGFSEGIFNHAALIWPDAVNTVELRKAALAGKPFQVRKLL